jgi:hypothetical protein
MISLTTNPQRHRKLRCLPSLLRIEFAALAEGKLLLLRDSNNLLSRPPRVGIAGLEFGLAWECLYTNLAAAF